MTPMEFILCVLAIAACSFVGMAYAADWIARRIDRRRGARTLKAAIKYVTAMKGSY